jgi:hypothetical protein
MRLAIRSMTAIGLMVLSLLAKAQTPSAPSAPPPTITSSMQSPGIPLAPPDLRLTEPMSQRLILVRAPSFWGSFKLDRAGITLVDSPNATGLDVAVAGSDRAVGLALEAHSNLVTGSVLTWTGLGVVLASAVGVFAAWWMGGYAPRP